MEEVKSNSPDINALNKMYDEAVTIDRRIFAEQRSNVLLYAGEHYAKTDSKIWGPIREMSKLDNSTKIRITKNHTQKICNIFSNGLITYAPGVAIGPRNEKELQDQKAAELHNSVWQYIKETQHLDAEIENYAQDFIVHGEVFAKVGWNDQKGRHVAYKQAVDKDGNPMWDQEPDEATGFPGVPTQGDAVFSGELEFTRLFSFNMLRDSRARSIKDSSFLCYQQLMPIEDAKVFCNGDKSKIELVEGSDADSADYVAFDIGDRRYVETKDQCLIMEWFFRPCAKYPKGLYIMSTKRGKIMEMELPNGIFPIVYGGCSEMSNTPRHYSIIKVLRPLQAEVNRCASKVVEHQITLGDDKVVSPMGGKMSQGATLPGVRHIQVSGDVKVIEGRSGAQYLDWLTSNIAEMYSIVGLPEEEDEKNVNLDAYQLLNMSMKQKKRFSKLVGKFERFLKDLAFTALDIHRFYVPDDELIPMIGRTEQVNIEEYRNASPLSYQIKVQEQTDDMESKLGKTLQINQLIQYAGNNLQKEDLGRLMRNSPYANKEGLFEDWTTEYDNATNDILALDRGKYPPARMYDKHEYQVQRLESRMSKSDYPNLHPFVQSLYQKKVEEHNQAIAINLQKVQLAQSGFIPADGPLIPIDLYVQDPTSPKKTQRARIPMGAALWLIKKLESQGVQQQALMSLSQGGQAQLANHLPSPPSAPGASPDTSNLNDLQQPYLSQPGGAQT